MRAGHFVELVQMRRVQRQAVELEEHMYESATVRKCVNFLLVCCGQSVAGKQVVESGLFVQIGYDGIGVQTATILKRNAYRPIIFNQNAGHILL